MSRYLAQSAAAVLVALLMGLSDSNLRWSIDHAQARANFQLPWPANVQHRISTGYTYGCGTHTGSLYYSLDFQFASNESIAAASGGVVIEKSDLGGSSYGKYIRLDHGGGITTLYGHMNSWASATDIGSWVKPGQVIGYAGATGYVLPAGAVHLHFEPRKNGGAYLLEPMSAVASFGQWGTGGASCVAQGSSPYWYGIPSRADVSTFYGPTTSQGILHTFLSNGTSAFTYQSPPWYDSGPGAYTLSQVQGRMVTGDFTGDGRRDIATLYGSGSSATMHVWRSTGTAFAFQSGMTWSSSSLTLGQVADRMVAGDFNGDGFDDIAVFYQSGSSGVVHVWTSASNGTALSYAGTWSSATYDLSQVANRFVAADFNRDGRTDIATLYSTGTNAARIDVWLSNGSSFGARQTWFTSSAYTLSVVGDRFIAGDFNGDGRTDLASFYQSGTSGLIHVWTSTGTGLTWGGTWSTNSSYTLSNVAGRMVAGDWSGLGYDDVATFYSAGTNSARIDAWLSSGTGFGSRQTWFSSASYTLGVVGDRMVGGDFDDK